VTSDREECNCDSCYIAEVLTELLKQKHTTAGIALASGDLESASFATREASSLYRLIQEHHAQCANRVQGE
jgi:hypothetical protein